MGNNVPIKKALIVAGGFGTRFLPASKTVPKVMFPVIDRPIIQMVVEEIVTAGITDITIVVSKFTREIERYFRPFEELNKLLENFGKQKEIEELKKIEDLANFTFVEQIPGRHGNGMAVLSAKDAIGNEPFIICWADEFFISSPSRIKQSIDAYERYGGMIVGCMKTVDPIDGGRYGFAVGEKVEDYIWKVTSLVEKPGVGKAPSELATKSGNILLPEIFSYLEKADKEIDPKLELYVNTYGMVPMLKDGFPTYAIEFQNSKYYDTGDRLGYLKSLVELGMENPQFGEDFKDWLNRIRLQSGRRKIGLRQSGKSKKENRNSNCSYDVGL